MAADGLERLRLQGLLERCFASACEAAGYVETRTASAEPRRRLWTAAADLPPEAELCQFIDARGEIWVLRPDWTTSVARQASAALAGASRPLRLWYRGPRFRRDPNGGIREERQLGAECIGQPAPAGDVEILLLLIASLQRLALPEWYLAVGHVGLLQELLDVAGLVEDARDKVMGSLQRRDWVSLRAVLPDDAMVPQGGDGTPVARSEDTAQVPPLWRLLTGRYPLADAPPLLQGLPSWRALAELQEALAAQAAGDGTSGAEAGEEAASGGASPAGAARASAPASGSGRGRRGLPRANQARPSPRIEIEPGLVRDPRYYTGLVFEILVPNLPSPIGAGGRYDHLLAHWGTAEPACGFALQEEALLDCLEEARRGEDVTQHGELPHHGR